MPRQNFWNDIARCSDEIISNICDVRHGDEAGTFGFSYLSESLPSGVANIQAMIPEVYDYPTSHGCFLYIENDDEVPAALPQVLSDLTDSLAGKSVSQILQAVSKALNRSLKLGNASNPILLGDAGDEEDINSTGGAKSPSTDSEDNGDDEIEEDNFSQVSGSWQLDDDSQPKYETARRSNNSSLLLLRARADLRVTKKAGFRVGVLGDLNAGGIVCVSIRVTKLGISEEAMQAWGLHRKHYLVVMIRYCDGYKTLDEVSEMPNLYGRTAVHVSLCKCYKPTFADALVVFAPTTHVSKFSEPIAEVQSKSSSDAGDTPAQPIHVLETLFIGQPLNDLLQTRFPAILKCRIALGFQWDGAEQFLNDNQGKPLSSDEPIDNKYYASSDDSDRDRAVPQIVEADAIGEILPSGQKHSLPLVTMQFLLRHFVRCTEFCLVCHCRVDDTFEALKPYVCSKPLCLYQYMSLGFGPSIEWEVLSQPYVVDLLVSFCYSSARQGRLRDFPVGIGLHVPIVSDFFEPNHQNPGTPRPYVYAPPTNKASKAPEKSFIAKYHQQSKEVVLQGVTVCPVRPGDWIVMLSKNIDGRQHCRVEEVVYFPTIKVGQIVIAAKSTDDYTGYPYVNPPGQNARQTASTPAQSPKTLPEGSFEVQCFLYDKLFDDMSDDHKRQGLTSLLDTLPDVYTMRNYLEMQSSREPSLRKCQKISEPALNLLRWIIASNRSCILQVDKTLPKHLGSSGAQTPTFQTASIGGTEDRVSGMQGWMQFRFAQGAPDKEQRFVYCVNQETTKNLTKFPTIFAWHGSPLQNWHSIIREGLHFNETVHGRAYGHGVYMSPHASTSIGYSQDYGRYDGQNYSGPSIWPNSVLGISQALALNEVVNSRKDFKSTTPHYVVDQIQWIQTRYLFVKASKATEIAVTDSAPPQTVYTQDPTAIVQGEKGTAIAIPITAVSKSRRPAISPGSQNSGPGTKKAKSLKKTDQQTAEDLEDAANSDVSDNSDLDFLESDEEEQYQEEDFDDDYIDWEMNYPSEQRGGFKRSSNAFLMDSHDPIALPKNKMAELKILPDASKTKFVPGRLDVSKLKMLKEPSDASTATTKTLMRVLKELSKVQDSTPLNELGWYIHRGIIENMYQWIVELHSFDPELPLAKDLEKVKLTSVVLEFRFTNSFPFSPPFVRVVTPRFLPFNLGGGGHVTLGGAICMELLTNNGWLATNSIESVLLQIRLALSSTEPKPARLQIGGAYEGESYGVGEAIEAYKRACAVHGWTVPKDFDTLQRD